MDKKMLSAMLIAALLGATFAAYVFWQYNHQKPELVLAHHPPAASLPAASAPTTPPAIETTPPQPPLPQLAKSDGYVFGALAALMDNPSLMKVFRPERLIHNIVVTIDSLPERRVPPNMMPFNPPPGHFLTAGPEGRLTIGPRNAARYSAYVKLAQAIDPKELVTLYVRLYPLFQQAYRDLGYTDGNFNSQLNDTLDDLLDTPDVKEPLRLIQPRYFYLYADPEIEESSIGQKILLRLGSRNMKIIKSKLNEIKQELSRQMP